MSDSKSNFEGTFSAAQIRTPIIKVLITKWDWSSGSPSKVINISHALLQFRWMIRLPGVSLQ